MATRAQPNGIVAVGQINLTVAFEINEYFRRLFSDNVNF